MTWEIFGGSTTAPVDASGVFTAWHPGIYTVVATSMADSTLKGSAIMAVAPSVKGLENVPAALDLEGYSVTVLQDGKVLIAGGQNTRVIDTDPVKGYRGTAFLYDPETKAFSPTGNLLQARGYHTATRLNDGRVLIAGGLGYFSWPGQPNAQVLEQGVKWGEVYNPVTGQFEALPVNPVLPLAPAGLMRSSHGANGSATLMADGRVMVVGGFLSSSPYNAFDIFDRG